MKLSKLNRKQAIAIGIAILVVIGVGGYFLLIKGARERYQAAVKERDEAKAQTERVPSLEVQWDRVRAEHARAEIIAALDYAHIVKVSEEEIEFLFGHSDLDRGADALLARPDVRLVVITRGEHGCCYRTRTDSGALAGLRPAVVDTTGAGDAFVAALLRGVLETVRDGDWDALSGDRLRRIVTEANAAGALTTTRKGAIPGLPTAAQLSEFLAGSPGQ